MAGKKAQGQISEYHDFVIRGLVGIEGTSSSDVTSRIIGFWIRDNEERLGKIGLSIGDWTGLMRSTSDNVVAYGNSRARNTDDNEKGHG